MYIYNNIILIKYIYCKNVFSYQYKNMKKLIKSNTIKSINNFNIKKILLLLKIDIYTIRHILIFPYSYIRFFYVL